MKITVEISDALLVRAKRHARHTGRPLRALIEDGLRHVLDAELARQKYQLPDLSVGDAREHDPLEALSWQDLRDEVYGGRYAIQGTRTFHRMPRTLPWARDAAAGSVW